MKKEYKNPKFEIVTIESEKVLAESSYDPNGSFSKPTDHEWYPDN